MRYMEATDRDAATLAAELARDAARDEALCDGHSAHENEHHCDLCGGLCADWRRCPICSRLVCGADWSDGVCAWCAEMAMDKKESGT